MRVLQVKSIPTGSSSYVSNMLRMHLNSYCQVDDAPDVRSIGINPYKIGKFYRLLGDYDILHVHLGKAGRLVSRFNRNKLTLATLHGFQKIRHYHGIDRFVAVSAAVRDHFIAQGVPPDTIRVIPNGVEEKFFRLPLQRNNDIFTISQVGHLTKNLDLSLMIISRLKKRGYRVRFMVAGGSKRPDEFSGLISRLDITDEVKFLGYVPAIEDVYANSDLLISSSIKEGFHLPVLEAMASGIPVVTTDSLGVRDYFIDGENGFFGSLDADHFTDKVEILLDSPELAKAIGKRNRERAAEFCWENVARKYFEYYQICLKL